MNLVKLFLLCVYVICPFIDMYNGYVQMLLNSQTVVPILFKMGIIFFSLFYILRFNKTTFFLQICSILFFVCLFYWSCCGYVSKHCIEEMKSISKIIYPYSIFIILYAFKGEIGKHQLLHYILFFGLISAVSILFLDFIGVARHTYGSNYGYGVKGFYKAGNDIGLTLIMTNCISAYYLSERNCWRYVACNIIFYIACLRLGSTAGMAGVIISMTALLIQPLFVKRPFSRIYFLYRKLLLFIGIPLAIYSIVSIVNTDSYTMRKFDIDNILAGNARNPLKHAYYEATANFSAADHLWGIGKNELTRRIGYCISSTRTQRALEVDHLELIGTYGLLLGFALLLYPFIYFIKCLFHFVSFPQLLPFWLLIAMCLFFFHAIFAGHAYTSVMAMSVLVSFMFLSDNH